MLLRGWRRSRLGFRRALRERFGAMAVQEFAEDAVSCFRESGAGLFRGRGDRGTAVDGARASGATVERGVAGVAATDAGAQLPRCGRSGRRRSRGRLEHGTRWWTWQRACSAPSCRFGCHNACLRCGWQNWRREFGDALLVVERNNHGAGVLAFLERMKVGCGCTSRVTVRVGS